MRNITKAFFVIILGTILGFVAYSVTRGNPIDGGRVSISPRIIEINRDDPDMKTLSNVDIEPISMELKIQEGIELLLNSDPLGIDKYVSDDVCFRNGKTYRAQRKEIAFAILDRNTGQVFEKRCWFSKEDVEQADVFKRSIDRIMEAFGLGGGDSEENIMKDEFALIVNWWNSHNSDIEVRNLNFEDDPDRYLIVANKYPIPNQYLAYPEDRTGEKYSDIVYVPYSGGLHISELIDEGKNFLNAMVDRAFEELLNNQVESFAYPGRFVAGAIDKKFVKNIFLTEQIDPGLIMIADDGGLKLAERVFVRLGTNKEKAFRYTYSSVGALGLGQIMPQTYVNVRDRYPSASLIQNKNIGRVDIVNGIKATVLVLDDHLATVFSRLNETASGRAAISKKNDKELEEIMAAIYNGGPGKINSQTAAISSSVSETVNFIIKFKKIRDLNLF